MKGLNLTTKDLQHSTNPSWRAAAGGASDAKPRAKRFQGPTSQSKAWAREMSKGPGRFFQTGRMVNWLNSKINHFAKTKMARDQHRMAQLETAAIYRPNQNITQRLPFFVVKLVRYGPAKLDTTDGLRASLKYFVDGIADALGVDDGDESAVRFEYDQRLSEWDGKILPVWGLRIEILEERR